MTSLDEELIVVEHLDFDITCGTRFGCDQKAVWSHTYYCCQFVVLFCDFHKIKEAKFLASALAEDKSLVCNSCHNKNIDALRMLEGFNRL